MFVQTGLRNIALNSKSFGNRVLLVDDVIAAFQRLAHGVYSEWNKPVVAITGSAGKTTAKELTAHVLESSGRKVLRNIKNFNNGLGHPLDGPEARRRSDVSTSPFSKWECPRR